MSQIDAPSLVAGGFAMAAECRSMPADIAVYGLLQQSLLHAWRQPEDMDNQRTPHPTVDVTGEVTADATARHRRRIRRLLAVVVSIALAMLATAAVFALLQGCWLCIGPGGWLGIG